MNNNLDKSGRLKKLITLAKSLNRKAITDAIELYKKASGDVHSYTNSTGYDLLVDGERYPPKVIFGLALSKLLAFEVLSSHFAGGIDSPCFKTIIRLGFDIVEKPRPGVDEGLVIYQKYNRKSVSKIFDPDCIFKTGSGKWGLPGIISHAPCKNDYIFFVTLDGKAGNDYEDYLTEDGVLIWMSQNQHTPNCDKIRSLVGHNEEFNNIYLFVRTSKGDDYTFMGPLALRDWNPNSSNPVHFMWDIMNWPLPNDVHEEFKHFIKPPITPGYKALVFNKQTLIEVDKPPVPKNRKAKNNSKTSENTDWAARERKNRELGLAGEKLVIEYERNILRQLNRHDLAEKVHHIALQNSSAGYDVSSFNDDGSNKHIEVKTTSGSKANPFYISRNEVSKSKELAGSFWIYRLFNFDYQNDKTEFYTVNGSVEDNFSLVAESYKAAVK